MKAMGRAEDQPLIHVHISLGQFLLAKKSLKGQHQALHEELEGSLQDEPKYVGYVEEDKFELRVGLTGMSRGPIENGLIVCHAWKHWKGRTSLELLDPTIRDSYSRIEVNKCIHIALLCVQENPAKRPTMDSIILMLNSNSVTLSSPQRPAFFLQSGTEQNVLELELDQSKGKSILLSVDEASITEVYPR
ncbi:cysteine-rich receptor-like protein kinase 10 [Quercus suber]|uniref:Cysteine-rich receptor-like protein kinase 10 n=1 Tax=Quercus suber TaxID=58331 RepID=A0AAW0KWA5_QUESU